MKGKLSWAFSIWIVFRGIQSPSSLSLSFHSPVKGTEAKIERILPPFLVVKFSEGQNNKELLLFFPSSFIFISWRLITLQYCSGFCHTLTWLSHGFTCVPHPISPSASLPTPSFWVIPMHQPRAIVSCIQPGLVICFTLDNIHVSMLFSQITPLSPSPTESQLLFSAFEMAKS